MRHRIMSLILALCLTLTVLPGSAEQSLTTYISEEFELSFSVNSAYRVYEENDYVWVYPGESASNFRVTWVEEEFFDPESFFRDTGEALRDAMGDSMVCDPGTTSEPLNLRGIAMDAMIYAFTDAESGQTVEGAYCVEHRDDYFLVFGAAYLTDEADAVLSALVLASQTFAKGATVRKDSVGSFSIQDSALRLSGLCMDFAKETARFSEAYKTSFSNGDSTYAEQMINYTAACEATLQEIVAVESAFKQTSTEDLDAENAFRYEKALEVCRIAEELLGFYIGYYRASDPLGEYQTKASQGEYAAPTDSIYAMYMAMGQVRENYQALHCPISMEQLWPQYIRQVDAYQQKLYADYKATELGDALMAYSSQQLLMRQPFHMLQCELILYAVLEQQFYSLANMLTLTAQSQQQIWPDYSMVTEVYPNLYPSMNSAINLSLSTNVGSARLLVEAEIEGFTQKYQQIVTATPEISYMMIKPPVLSELTNLNSERTTQLTLRVTQMDTDEILVMETRNVTLHSIYDFTMMNTEFGIIEPYNLLAWLRPDTEALLTLRREAISWLETNVGADFNSLPGYQLAYPEGIDEVTTTALQAIAIQSTLSDMGVRYNMGPYSFGGFQRVLTPDKVIESRSGICVETALLMASVLQSMDMHAMLLILPGHAQVAVETWRDSGEYILLETTKLPFSGTLREAESFSQYLTSEEWLQYLSGDGIYVIDCDLAGILDIRGLPYK